MKEIITTDFHAQIIADSINQFGNRLTTFVVTFPRIILAEFNTHRMFSRNSASSRAIPFEKMLKRVQEHPFVPIKWMKDHSGMQGVEYFEGEYDSEEISAWWLAARDKSISFAKDMSGFGLTKQIVNRLLEPWMWHTVIVTASEWQNFFALRVHEAAEIHMQKIAGMMLEQYNNSTPKQLKAGEWHIPFGENIDEDRITRECGFKDDKTPWKQWKEQRKVEIAVARCARVSYLNFEGQDDYEADIKLHNRLADMGHWSPFEHVAKAMGKQDLEPFVMKIPRSFSEFDKEQIKKEWNRVSKSKASLIVQHQDIEIKSLSQIQSNFNGFIQYRKMFDNENKTDSRVCRK